MLKSRNEKRQRQRQRRTQQGEHQCPSPRLELASSGSDKNCIINENEPNETFSAGQPSSTAKSRRKTIPKQRIRLAAGTFVEDTHNPSTSSSTTMSDCRTSLSSTAFVGAIRVDGPHLRDAAAAAAGLPERRDSSTIMPDLLPTRNASGNVRGERGDEDSSSAVMLEAERVIETPLVYASAAGGDSNQQERKSKRCRMLAIGLACLVIAVAGIVGGIAGALVGASDQANPTTTTTTTTSPPPTTPPITIEVVGPSATPTATSMPTKKPTLTPIAEGEEFYVIDTPYAVQQNQSWVQSLAMSGDGTIMVVSQLSNNLVRTYFRVGTRWDQDSRSSGDIMYRDDNIGFGYALTLSRNGQVVAIGAPFFYDYSSDDYPYDIGRVFLYQWNRFGWELCVDINGTNPVGYFGSSLDLSDDGDILAVGAPNSDDGAEVSNVQIYNINLNDCTSSQMGNWLVSLSQTGDTDNSVKLSGDGMTIAVAFNDLGSLVQVYEWSTSEEEWIPKGDPIDSENSVRWGNNKVALSNDGTVVAVTYYTGDARVFEWSSEGQKWVQKGTTNVLTIPVSDPFCPYFYSIFVELSRDGNVLLLANDHEVYGYRFYDNDWQSIFHLASDDGDMAISDDASFMAVVSSMYIQVYH